jgi:hypothetical protein
MPERDAEKKKPTIEYEVSADGNIIDASVDDKTHFISIRRQAESRMKGGGRINITGVRAEAEKERKDEWTAVVWEEGELMPPAVWDEKRRNELLSDIKGTISAALGSDPKNVTLTNHSGSVVSWPVSPPSSQVEKDCRECGAKIPSYSQFCPICGKQQ